MNWLDLLKAAVDADPRGIAGVADVLGISRTALSMAINGKYPAKTDKIAQRVLAHYDRHDCPHTGESIVRAACHALASRQAPTNSPREMRHWRACQGCEHKPKE